MHMFNGATVFNNGDVAGGSSNPLNWDTSRLILCMPCLWQETLINRLA